MMTEWLIRKFVINPDDIQDERTRFSYGILTSAAGIACNMILFLLKLAGGILMQSISVLTDSFNNLSDCFSGLIALFGYKAAAKPADEEHPFGHGRMEYIISLAIAAMIFIAAFELLKASAERILSPVKILFDPLLFLFIVLTIPVKLWLSRLNYTIGEKIDSMPMRAVAEDAKNDVFATCISLGAMAMSAFYEGFPFDGIAGVIVSCLIFRSGFQTASDIVTKLLGAPTDPSLIREIRNIILEEEKIKGVHDIVIHEYGPGKLIGSAHAEIDGSMELNKVHAVIDRAEKKIRGKLGIDLTIHADPVTDTVSPQYRKIISFLQEKDASLSVHDFHEYDEEGKQVLDFDILIPFNSSIAEEEICGGIRDLFDESVRLEIRFDHGYAGEENE